MDEIVFLEKMVELTEGEPGSLKLTDQLSEIDGWDSMVIIEFMAMADEEFGVAIAPAAIKACSSLGDLLALVSKG